MKAKQYPRVARKKLKISVTVHPDVVAEIERLAAAENRPRSQIADRVLREGLGIGAGQQKIEF